MCFDLILPCLYDESDIKTIQLMFKISLQKVENSFCYEGFEWEARHSMHNRVSASGSVVICLSILTTQNICLSILTTQNICLSILTTQNK
jgi:hypothetical protein